MSNIFGHRGGGHHGGGFRGTPWAGWGRYGDPYAYARPYPYEDIDDYFEVLIPVAEGVNLADDAEVLGAVDVGAWQHQMNALKQVPVSVARVMLSWGTRAIMQAISVASRVSLPGDTSRQNVLGKLRWHAAQLSAITDPYAMYVSGDDLKKWVLAAYVEGNAAEEGAATVATAWGRMWNEIGVAIAALPVQIAAKINETTGALLGVPGWVVGVSVLGILGLAAYTYTKAVGGGHGKFFDRILPVRKS